MSLSEITSRYLSVHQSSGELTLNSINNLSIIGVTASNEVLGGAVGIVHGVTKDILGDDQGIDWEKEVSNFFDPQG